MQGMAVELQRLQRKVEEFGEAGGDGSLGGQSRPSRGIMKHKPLQLLKPLVGDKGTFRQWHQKLVSALYAVDESYGRIVKLVEVSCDTGTKPEDMMRRIEEEFDNAEHFSNKSTRSSWARPMERLSTRSGW